ncbi:SET domain protein [Flagelloscypha sp. PMI_526]|nr:SET domain protein [Flagelloscypha sp. PMI_526]
MTSTTQESESVLAFRRWLKAHGSGYHNDLTLHEAKPPGIGLSVFASQFLPPETRIVSCSTSLVITKELAEKALFEILGLADSAFQGWNERQFQVSYIALHSIVQPRPKQLAHGPYLDILPPATNTSVYFNEDELSSFKGSNLYGATLDRCRDWEDEWKACCQTISRSKKDWADGFTWDMYLVACTYLTSRAFPSDLLSDGSEIVYPVLIPGLDSFNHARDQDISWIGASPDDPSITLLQHKVAIVGQELFIDYGPKPNSELILGYGLDARQMEPKACDISYEDHLSASDALVSMALGSLDRLPNENVENPKPDTIRAEVWLMRKYYIQGQRAILQELLAFAKQKEKETIQAAQEEGIELILEGDEVAQ